jgi:tetratricopeptide (TPR) repeat protein
MIGLRKLVGIALVASLFTGLSGCGKRTGDLGAEHDDAPVVRNEPVTSSPTNAAAATGTAKSSEPAAEAVELADASKDVVAENVKLDRPADREGDTAKPADPAMGEVKDGEEPKPAPTPEPAPAPTPAPDGETPEARAARLLQEAQRLADVKTQGSLTEAEAAYQAGLKLFNDLEYEEARKYFERAVTLDPAHSAALAKLRVTNSLLGVHADRIGQKIRELEQAERVKMQESVVVLAQAMEEARVLE